jgi:hypothetical protein
LTGGGPRLRVGHCGINGYETNEQIVHATSRSVLGPWKRHGPVQPFGSSAICPHALRAPDGKWLIFHTGCGNHSDPSSEGFGTNHSRAHGRVAVLAPCTHCLRHGDPMHTQKCRAVLHLAFAVVHAASGSDWLTDTLSRVAVAGPIINCVNGSTPTHRRYAPPPSPPMKREEQAPTPRVPSGAPPTCGVASDITSVFVASSPFGPWTQQRLDY